MSEINKEHNQEMIDIGAFLRYAMHKWPYILLSTVVGAIGFLTYWVASPPRHTSTAIITTPEVVSSSEYAYKATVGMFGWHNPAADEMGLRCYSLDACSLISRFWYIDNRLFSLVIDELRRDEHLYVAVSQQESGKKLATVRAIGRSAADANSNLADGISASSKQALERFDDILNDSIRFIRYSAVVGQTLFGASDNSVRHVPPSRGEDPLSQHLTNEAAADLSKQAEDLDRLLSVKPDIDGFQYIKAPAAREISTLWNNVARTFFGALVGFCLAMCWMLFTVLTRREMTSSEH